jgi:hypothetical protein
LNLVAIHRNVMLMANVRSVCGLGEVHAMAHVSAQ